MAKQREVKDVDLENISAGGSSIKRPCRDCLPCPPPGNTGPGLEREEWDDEGTLRDLAGEN
jgi:hypothetical protein